MNPARPATLALLGLLAAAPILPADDDTPSDLLRLKQGELEGRFAGIDEVGILRWERDDATRPLEFRAEEVRKVVLRGGVDDAANAETSHVGLVNGDRIPGRVVELDADNVTLETPLAGTVVIPRDAVASIAPSPYGGRLIYAGPYTPDGWIIEEAYQPAADDEEQENANEEGDEEQEKAEDLAWRHLGSRFYFKGGDESLRRAVDLPAKSIFRFGELKDSQNRMEAEYIIIGTLLSFAWGVAAAWGTMMLMQELT